jgi:U4/U6.U5 tri-snRNP-associated protein 3
MQLFTAGFGGFSSTKGEQVEDNKKGPAKGAVSKNKAREYRQYMNRRGGFNRPLAKMP